MEGGGNSADHETQEDADEPKSWWSKQRQEAKSFNVEDCTGCRYIAAFGMYGSALYVGATSIKRRKLRGASAWSVLPALAVSGLMVGLGTIRLMGMNPFSSTGRETGIDGVEKAFLKLAQVSNEKNTDDNVKS